MATKTQTTAHRTIKNMHKKFYFSTLLTLVVILMLVPTFSWLYVKLYLSHNTNPHSTTWSDSGACYINSYIPNFRSLGVPGITVELFSSAAFFRVYRKDGTLVKNSEWLLWQREFADSESEKWVNGNAIYPTDDGYAGWSLRECG
jgi:ABC-type dipeptide/oligopeptide/nickel transport system permease component